jgi:vitamin B12 transporter
MLLFSQHGFAVAFSEDSLGNKKLKEVTVNGHQLQVARAAMPVQVFSEKELGSLNASSVSDVAKHFAGVTVKDYGGIGGMKTVSIRGLGAMQTGVSYDGVMLSDVQTGQIDLSRYSLENVSEVSVCNGQPNDVFQTARMYSFAGTLNITTKSPIYNPLKTFESKISAKTGSFGLINSTVHVNKSFNKRWSINFTSDALFANGKYQFIQHYGSLSNQSAVLTRTNGDVTTIRNELNAIYQPNEIESFSIKTNYLFSDRGLPANIFYNGYSEQRMKENNLFTQFHYLRKDSPWLQQQFFAKHNRQYSNFTDLAYYSEYTQNEYYSSYSAKYQPICGISTSIAADWWLNTLEAKSIYNNNFGYPKRNTELVNLSAKYSLDRLIAFANLLSTFTQEQVKIGSAAPNRQRLSPSMCVSYQLLPNESLNVRAFYKDIFRLPSFNDLYYQDFGNSNLKPETTSQYNIGVIYQLSKMLFFNNIELSLDAYHNSIKDKIIASPKGPAKWTMENKDYVEIKGIDINIKSAIIFRQANELLIRLNYTYNKATDLTQASFTYGKQIPYTPLVSGSSSITYKNKIMELGYNLLYSGLRWVDYNSSKSILYAFNEHSVYFSTQIKTIQIKGELINILNTQYEVIKFYPMPGRNFRVTISKII